MQLHPPSKSSVFENRIVRAVLLALLASSLVEGRDEAAKTAPAEAVPIRIGSKVETLESTDPVLPGKGRYRSFRLVPRASGKKVSSILHGFWGAHRFKTSVRLTTRGRFIHAGLRIRLRIPEIVKVKLRTP